MFKNNQKKTLNGIHQRLSIINDEFGVSVTYDQLMIANQFLKRMFPFAKINLDDIMDALFVSSLIYSHQACGILEFNDKIRNNELFQRFGLFFKKYL